MRAFLLALALAGLLHGAAAPSAGGAAVLCTKDGPAPAQPAPADSAPGCAHALCPRRDEAGG